MASNFTMQHHRRGGGLHLKLSGHFDGTSAYELKHCLQDALDRELRVVVHTDKLTSLSTFGREMFQKQFSVRPQITARIVFTGAYAQAIAPDGCPVQ
jgi:anti-anti-sigma regulatory factor